MIRHTFGKNGITKKREQGKNTHTHSIMKWVKFAWVETYKAKFGVLMRQSKYQWVHNLTYIFVLIVYKHITHSAHKTCFGPFGCHTAKRLHVLAEKRCHERHYNMVNGAIGLKPENSKGDIYRYIWGAFKFLISTLSFIIIRIFCISGSLFLISIRKLKQWAAAVEQLKPFFLFTLYVQMLPKLLMPSFATRKFQSVVHSACMFI